MFKLKDTTTHHIPKPSFSDVLSTSTFANILAIIGIIIVILCIFSITFILIFRLSMSNVFTIISAILQKKLKQNQLILNPEQI